MDNHRFRLATIPCGHTARPDVLPAIEALRWIAAMLVAFLHADHERLKLAGRSGDILAHHVVELGIGVDVFFYISGFLMVHVSRGRFGRGGEPWRFFVRRLRRLAPLYWLATGGMLAAILLVPSLLNQHVLRPAPVVMSFLFVAWPDAEGHVFPVLNSGWTLNLEIFFYLVFAVALRFRQAVAVGLVVACLGVAVLLAAAWPGAPWWVAFYGQPIALEFAGGVLLGVLFASGRRIGLPSAAAICVGAVLLHAGLRSAWADVPRLPGNGIPAGLVFLAVVFCRPVTLPRAVTVAIQVLGRSSYAVYLTSPFAITAVSVVLVRAGIRNPVVLIGCACAASALAALAVSAWIEAPIARHLRPPVRRAALEIQ